MSSQRTLGGLPVLLEPARTRNDGTITHDHAKERSLRGRPKGS